RRSGHGKSLQPLRRRHKLPFMACTAPTEGVPPGKTHQTRHRRSLRLLTIGVNDHGPTKGFTRRSFLRAGALGVAGLGLADLLRQEARATPENRRPKSVIYVVLGGGPSHIDAWDLKPDAPDEFRGPFKPIATTLPGVRICEHMPQQAGIMH